MGPLNECRPKNKAFVFVYSAKEDNNKKIHIKRHHLEKKKERNRLKHVTHYSQVQKYGPHANITLKPKQTLKYFRV